MANDDRTPKDPMDGQELAATPKDVAGLYSWANLKGSKYRDFSASRKRSRAAAHDRKQVERFTREQDATAGTAAEIQRTQSHREMSEPGTNLRRLSIAAVPAFASPHEKGCSHYQAPGPRKVVTAVKNKNQRGSIQGGSARWTALKNVFEPPEERQEVAAFPPVKLEIPALAFVSLAGGVGKTSLVASLGCSLADHGESVLLVDTNAYGLLPLYFGATEFNGESIRTFASSTTAVPIQVMTMDKEEDAGKSISEVGLAERIAHHTYGMDRILIDVSTGSKAMARQALRISPRILVTLTPDMASVVSLQAVQTFFEHLTEESGRPFELFYLLNQFDPLLRLHMDVRALLTRQLGERLLPIVIHRSSAFSEALAEGMTVVDYAPDSQAAEDLNILGQWLREFDELPAGELDGLRWRER